MTAAIAQEIPLLSCTFFLFCGFPLLCHYHELDIDHFCTTVSLKDSQVF